MRAVCPDGQRRQRRLAQKDRRVERGQGVSREGERTRRRLLEGAGALMVVRLSNRGGQRLGYPGDGLVDELALVDGLLGAQALQLNLELGNLVLQIRDIAPRTLAALDGIVADARHVGALAGPAGGEAQVAFGLAVAAAVARLGDAVVGARCADGRHVCLPAMVGARAGVGGEGAEKGARRVAAMN